MHNTTRNLDPQPYTVFGGAYVREQHSEVADRHLQSSDIGKVVASLNVSMLYELMKALRSTLYIRRQG